MDSQLYQLNNDCKFTIKDILIGERNKDFGIKWTYKSLSEYLLTEKQDNKLLFNINENDANEIQLNLYKRINETFINICTTDHKDYFNTVLNCKYNTTIYRKKNNLKVYSGLLTVIEYYYKNYLITVNLFSDYLEKQEIDKTNENPDYYRKGSIVIYKLNQNIDDIDLSNALPSLETITTIENKIHDLDQDFEKVNKKLTAIARYQTIKWCIN